MMMQATGTTESAAGANDMCTGECAPAAAPAAPMPMPEPEENGLFYANSFALPDPETVARDFLWERDGSDCGECSIETVEDLGDYTPIVVDYTPVGAITAVRFDAVTVLVDETMTVFGVIE